MNTEKIKTTTLFFVFGMNKVCQEAAIAYSENLYLDGESYYQSVLKGVKLAKRWERDRLFNQRIYRKDNELIKTVMNNIEIEEKTNKRYNDWFNTFYQSDFPVKWGL